VTDTDTEPTDGYVPFRIDFDDLAAQLHTDLAGMPESERERVTAALRHLRDELPGQSDQQIARVLLAAAILGLRLVDAPGGQIWNGKALANFFAACGEQLWAESQPADA